MDNCLDKYTDKELEDFMMKRAYAQRIPNVTKQLEIMVLIKEYAKELMDYQYVDTTMWQGREKAFNTTIENYITDLKNDLKHYNAAKDGIL